MGGSPTAAASSDRSGMCASLSCTRRDRIRLLLFFALVIAYSLRVILSVAIISIAKEAGYTNEQEGIISAAFFVGYLILQLPGGWLAGRIGGWTVLGLGVLLPSLVTLATPPLATNYAGLIAMRVRAPARALSRGQCAAPPPPTHPPTHSHTHAAPCRLPVACRS